MWFSRKSDIPKLVEKDAFEALLKLVTAEDAEAASPASEAVAEMLADSRCPEVRLTLVLALKDAHAVDLLFRLLERKRGLSKQTHQVVEYLTKRNATPRLFQLLDCGRPEENVRTNVVEALVDAGLAVNDPDLVLATLKYIDPRDELLERGRVAAHLLTRCAEGSLLAALGTCRSYEAARILCDAIAEVGTEDALEPLANVPDLRSSGVLSVSVRTSASLAARSILTRMNDAVLASYAVPGRVWYDHSSEEIERRRRLKEATEELDKLASTVIEEKIEAIRRIAILGRWNADRGSPLIGQIRTNVVKALNDMVGRESDLGLRRAAHDALKQIGEAPRGFLP
jgi:hypothetical protein